MTSHNDVMPVVDLRLFVQGSETERRRVAAQVDEACRRTGFLIVTGHRVSKSVMDSAWKIATEFFDLPVNEKMQCAATTTSEPRGYFPMERETLSRSRAIETPPDLKEAFSCGPLNSTKTANDELDFFSGPNVWPVRPPEFRHCWETYYRAMETLSGEIMALFAAALRLPADYFAACFDLHASALRALNYPATDDAKPLQQRAGAHSDYGSLTVLRPDPHVSGLEIQLQDGTWFSAPSVGDDFIINIGDLMARWTNDRWTSTTHRVVIGSTSEPARRRQSIAFFQNPNPDAVIECLPGCESTDGSTRYEAITAGGYLQERFTATVDKKP